MLEPLSGPFLRREALASGMTRRLVDGRQFVTPTRGVRFPAGFDLGLLERCRSVQEVLPDDAAFSHVTALRLLGVEVPWQLDGDQRLHVTTMERSSRGRRPDLVAHFCGQAQLEMTVVTGIRVTTGPQTWLHLSHSLPLDAVVVLADGMLRRTDPASSIAELRRLMEATHKMRGLAKCRDALPLVRPGTDSTMETRARLLVVGAGLPCPLVNQPVLDASGSFVALPDMSYPELRLAIEYDGDVHRTDPATWRRDVERRQRLEDAGWTVVTATADDVLRYPDRFVERVRRARRRAVASR